MTYTPQGGTIAASVFDIAKRPRKPRADGPDVAKLKVERGVAYPTARVHVNRKYDSVFSSMQPGDSIGCTREHRDHIAAAMRKWIQRRGMVGKLAVRTVLDDGTGQARVWLMKAGKA